jgi:hypothetical protein
MVLFTEAFIHKNKGTFSKKKLGKGLKKTTSTTARNKKMESKKNHNEKRETAKRCTGCKRVTTFAKTTAAAKTSAGCCPFFSKKRDFDKNTIKEPWSIKKTIKGLKIIFKNKIKFLSLFVELFDRFDNHPIGSGATAKVMEDPVDQYN